MAYRQPFRSGLKDLAQGLLQQAQAQQQQSQMEAQMKQQMAAQQAQTTAQVGQTMGSSVMQAAGVIGQGLENRRAEQVRLSEQALKDGRAQLEKLMADQAELLALRDSGILIENFDALNDGMSAYINGLAGALSGDVADVYKRVGELAGVEVAPGVMGADALAAVNSALTQGRRERINTDATQGELRAQVSSTINRLSTVNWESPLDVVSLWLQVDVMQDILNNYPEMLPKGTKSQDLLAQLSLFQTAAMANPAIQEMYDRAKALGDANYNSQIGRLNSEARVGFDQWKLDGFVNEPFKQQYEEWYAAAPQRDENGKPLTFDEATRANAEKGQRRLAAQERLVDLQRESDTVDLELGLRWKEFNAQLENTDSALAMLNSLVAQGNVSALLSISRDPLWAQHHSNLVNDVIPSMLTEARGVQDIRLQSNQFAMMELEASIEAFPNETAADRTARGTAALMAQAAVLGEAGLLEWWGTLPPDRKGFYGGEATFRAALRDAQFVDLERGNDRINVALARVFPILNMKGTPENLDAARQTIFNTVSEITGDEDFAAQIVASAEIAWKVQDQETRSTMLRNIQLDLENQVMRSDVAAAAFALANPGQAQVDVTQFRQLLDTRRLNASSEHDAIMSALRGQGCILTVTTNEWGDRTETGGQNRDTPECQNLWLEERDVRGRLAEVDVGIIQLANAALGVSPEQRPTEVDPATQGAFINLGASQFIADYRTTGRLDTVGINEYVNGFLDEYFNLTPEQKAEQSRLLAAQIVSRVVGGNVVDYSDIIPLGADDGGGLPAPGPTQPVLPFEESGQQIVPPVAPPTNRRVVTGEGSYGLGGALRVETEAEAAAGGRSPVGLPPTGLAGLFGPDTREVIGPRIEALPRFSGALYGVSNPAAIDSALQENREFLQRLERVTQRGLTYETVQLSGGGTTQRPVPQPSFNNRYDAPGATGADARRQNERTAAHIAVQLGFGSLEEFDEYARTQFGINLYENLAQRPGAGQSSGTYAPEPTIVPDRVFDLLSRLQRDIGAVQAERRNQR